MRSLVRGLTAHIEIPKTDRASSTPLSPPWWPPCVPERKECFALCRPSNLRPAYSAQSWCSMIFKLAALDYPHVKPNTPGTEAQMICGPGPTRTVHFSGRSGRASRPGCAGRPRRPGCASRPSCPCGACCAGAAQPSHKLTSSTSQETQTQRSGKKKPLSIRFFINKARALSFQAWQFQVVFFTSEAQLSTQATPLPRLHRSRRRPPPSSGRGSRPRGRRAKPAGVCLEGTGGGL